MVSQLSPYLIFDRQTWCQFRQGAPLTLSEADLQQLKGQNESVSLLEVAEIYLPLSRLLNLYIAATQKLYTVTTQFLGHPAPKVPYVIGVAGSVAVGKSTTSRILQALLSRWPDHPRVVLITTDGFLY
jgi:type I pantothenate kinase